MGKNYNVRNLTNISKQKITPYVSKFYNENKNEIERSRESVLKFTKRNVD